MLRVVCAQATAAERPHHHHGPRFVRPVEPVVTTVAAAVFDLPKDHTLFAICASVDHAGLSEFPASVKHNLS